MPKREPARSPRYTVEELEEKVAALQKKWNASGPISAGVFRVYTPGYISLTKRLLYWSERLAAAEKRESDAIQRRDWETIEVMDEREAAARGYHPKLSIDYTGEREGET